MIKNKLAFVDAVSLCSVRLVLSLCSEFHYRVVFVVILVFSLGNCIEIPVNSLVVWANALIILL